MCFYVYVYVRAQLCVDGCVYVHVNVHINLCVCSTCLCCGLDAICVLLDRVVMCVDVYLNLLVYVRTYACAYVCTCFVSTCFVCVLVFGMHV